MTKDINEKVAHLFQSLGSPWLRYLSAINHDELLQTLLFMQYHECQGERCRADRRMNSPVASAQRFARRHVVDLHLPVTELQALVLCAQVHAKILSFLFVTSVERNLILCGHTFL